MISLRDFELTMSSQRKIRKLSVEDAIYFVRGQRVMLDSDLAAIYGVTTKRLNPQLRRNNARFPADFAFQLTVEELSRLKSQFVTSKGRGGRRKLPIGRSKIENRKSKI